jgi:hypothetical protein
VLVFLIFALQAVFCVVTDCSYQGVGVIQALFVETGSHVHYIWLHHQESSSVVKVTDRCSTLGVCYYPETFILNNL